MMRRFNITVNGKAYDVAVEEANGAAPVVATPAPVAAPATTPAPVAAPVVNEPAPAPVAAPVEGGTDVKAPMPGTIMDVKVNVGDTVERGQVVIVLEAMKMENDIVAPVSGTVASVVARKGDSVNANDILAVIS